MPVIDEFRQHSWIVNTARIDCQENRHLGKYADWYQWNQTQKSMEDESKRISTVRKQIGWTNCGYFKRIASMPMHIFTWLRHIDPEMFEHHPAAYKKFDRFLLRHPEFGIK